MINVRLATGNAQHVWGLLLTASNATTKATLWVLLPYVPAPKVSFKSTLNVFLVMKTALHAWMLQISIARCVTPKHTYLVLDSVLDRVPMGTRKIKFIIFVILTQRSSLNLN